jgi:hypothetical protein
MKDLKPLADVVKKTCGISIVDFEGFDFNLAKDITKQLCDMNSRYPEIFNNFQQISTIQKRVDDLLKPYIDAEIEEKGYPNTAENRLENKMEFLNHIQELQISNDDFAEFVKDEQTEIIIGIFINENWVKDYSELKRNSIENVKRGIHPKGTEKPVSLFTHEIGHAFHHFLITKNLDNDLNKIWEETQENKKKNTNFIKSGLSNYAETDIKEFIAEGFTEYINSKHPRTIAIKIGQAIDIAYKKFSG